jgi:hypothetical protein
MVYITRGLYPIFPHENPIYVLYYICIVSIIIPEKDVEQEKTPKWDGEDFSGIFALGCY